MMTEMAAVWTMALGNLLRRRMQSLLVGLVIGLATLLFFSGLGLMRELSGPFDRMFDEQRGSHLTLQFDSRVYDPEQIVAWFEGRSEVISVTPVIASVALVESGYFEGRELNSMLIVAERPAGELRQDELRAVAGDASGAPGRGELWISTALANETGIEPGDELEIPTYEGLRAMTVAAVVVDPQYSAPFNAVKRIWVGPGQLPLLYELADLSQATVGVRLADAAQAKRLWEAFVDHMGGAFSGDNLDYAGLQLGYMAPYNLMAAMMVAFSVLSVLIALFAIHGTITSAILADFRIIGILRTQGFRPQDVRNVYRFQYLALAVVAVPLGIVCGYPLVRQGVAILMSSTGTTSEGGSLWLIALVTAVLFIGLVWGFVGLVARRAARVRPSEAIRFGADVDAEAHGARFDALRLARFGVPFAIAAKTLFLQRRRSLLLVLSVVFATLAACLAVNLDHSFARASRDPSLLGFDSADVRVIRSGRRFGVRHDVMMEILTGHPDVAGVATSDFVEGELMTASGRTRAMLGTLVAGDIEALGYRNLEGRNPQGEDEVSVGINTAREYGFEVGDDFPLFIRGQELTLRITGLFQTVNNGGTGFRLRLPAMRRADPLYEPSRYGVVLREGVEPGAFVAALEARYGEAVDGQPGDYFIRSILDTVITGMRVSNGFLATVFLLAASTFIFNSTLMSIAENRRMFGILKTVGMTPRQLRRTVVIAVGLIAGCGVASGLVLWVVGAPLGLSLLFAGLGLVSFPLFNSLLGMALLVPVVLAFCLASGWLPSARLLELDPRSLIVE